MPGLKVSFCTIAYRNKPDHSVETILAELAGAGFQGVELWWPHVEKGSLAWWREIRERARSLKLEIPMLSAYLGTFNLGMTNREEMLQRMRDAIPAAEALGAPLLRAFAGWTCECSSLTATEEYWRYNLEGFKEMGQMAQAHGLRLALETHYKTLADSVAGVRRLAEFCGPRIRVNLQLDDIAANSGLPNGVAVYRELGSLVAHAHVPVPFENDEKRVEYAALIAELSARNFGGFVSIEHCTGKLEPLDAATEGLRFVSSVLNEPAATRGRPA